MRNYAKYTHLLLCLILLNLHSGLLAAPACNTLYDERPFSATAYYGIGSSNAIIHIFEGQIKRWPEEVASLELAYTLDKDNVIRRFFSPVVGVVQLTGNLSQRRGDNQHVIDEVNPYITFRWVNFPWNHIVNTSLAIGEGISYDSSIPSIEKKTNADTKRLLNYLMFEASFAMPQHPEWQVIARIHHRSGAFGLYRAGNTGSNIVGLGIRYVF